MASNDAIQQDDLMKQGKRNHTWSTYGRD